MPRAMTISDVRNIALPILRRHGVSRASIFGSCVRGEMAAGSDIDLLVELNRDISLLDFIRIKQEIEQAVGQTVDLVEYDAVKPLLKDQIMGEQVAIL